MEKEAIQNKENLTILFLILMCQTPVYWKRKVCYSVTIQSRVNIVKYSANACIRKNIL